MPPIVRTPRLTPSQTSNVTAIVVTRGLTPYLPQTLAGIASQRVSPDHLLLIDVDEDGQDNAWQLKEAIGQAYRQHESRPRIDCLHAPRARNFGDAVRQCLEAGSGWLWLLHDDSAPAPDALTHLVHATDSGPSVAIAGCKQIMWDPPARVLDVGFTHTWWGRRVGVDMGELDQGQYDRRQDVLGVGLAGMLISAELWFALDGPDPALGPFGDGLDLCMRARLTGKRVVVVPQAVVRHVQASHFGIRQGAAEGDPRRSLGARRVALVHSRLVECALLASPFVFLLAFGLAILRSGWRLLAKQPRLAATEFAAPWRALRLGRISAGRARAAKHRTRPRAVLRPLRARWIEALPHVRGAIRAGRARRRALSDSEIAAIRQARRHRYLGLASVCFLAVVLSAWSLRGVMAAAWSGQVLTGGGWGALDMSATELWQLATSGWIPGGGGSYGPADPLLVALVPLAFLTGGKAQLALSLCFGASFVLAGLGTWCAAGAVTRSAFLRFLAAAGWLTAPPLLTALSFGQPGPLMVHLAFPWLLLALAHAYGIARRDKFGHHHKTPSRSLTAAAAGGIALSVVGAAAPAVLIVAALVLTVAALLSWRRAWIAITVLALPVAVCAPALWRILTEIPAAVFATAGPGARATAASAVELIAGWPLAAPTGWVGLVPVACWLATAIAGLSRQGTAGKAVRCAWVLIAIGWAYAGIARMLLVAPNRAGDSGPGLTLAWAGLIAATLYGADGLASRMSSQAVATKRIATAVLVTFGMVVPTVSATWWALVANQHGGMQVSAVPTLPAAAKLAMQDNIGTRIAMLGGTSDHLDIHILSGDGPRLTDTAVTTQAQQEQYATVRQDFALLAAGNTGFTQTLATYGVGGVLLSGRADGKLLATLHAMPGLELVSTTEQGSYFRVGDGRAGFARLTSTRQNASLPLSKPLTINTALNLEPGSHRLVLAASADWRWRAWIDGQPLVSTTTGWQQSFDLTHSGQLEVSFMPPWRPIWISVLGFVAILTLLLAIPMPKPRRSS